MPAPDPPGAQNKLFLWVGALEYTRPTRARPQNSSQTVVASAGGLFLFEKPGAYFGNWSVGQEQHIPLGISSGQYLHWILRP